MDDDIFRKVEITDKSGTYILEQKNITDIYKFGQPPYIHLGATGSGKTTLSIDLMHTFSKVCSNIIYITSTDSKISDNTMDQIPKFIRREPTIQNFVNCWREITHSYDCINPRTEDLTKMLSNIYGSNVALNLISKLNKEKERIASEQLEKYKKSNNNYAYNNASDDANAFYYDTIVRIIFDGIKVHGTNKLTNNEMAILNGFVSRRQRTLLIMDDVTSALESSSKSTEKIKYNNTTMNAKDAMQTLLTDILTRGRHYNCIICIFLHQLDALNKSTINNLIVMDQSAAKKISNARTFSDTVKNKLISVIPYIWTKKTYRFLYMNLTDEEKVCVGKAKLYLPSDKMEFDDLINNFKETYDTISAGINIEELNNEQNEDSDEDIDLTVIDRNDDIEEFI